MNQNSQNVTSGSPVRLSLIVMVALAFLLPRRGFAQEASARPGAKTPGRFVTVTSPMDDRMISHVKNAAIKLQEQAEREDRDAVLVLEIEPGSSRLLQVVDLARKLTSADTSRIRTVAYVPRTVEGTNAILALACNDIVMHPDASLGDIGRGQTLPEEDQNLVLGIVDRRRNGRLSRGIAKAMMDPQVALLRIQTEGPGGQPEQKFLTADELRVLQNQDAVISETAPIKDIGVPGSFAGDDALRSGFLVAETARSRRDVLTLYDLTTESMREDTGAKGDVHARVIAIDDVIEPILGDFVIREMRKAINEGVNIIIFDIHSPGGYLITAEEIALSISELDPRKVTTVAWIRKEAISGAAIVALGCDRIVMHPDATLGDAGVIMETAEGGGFERAPEKAVSIALKLMGDLAKRRNRPVALLEAMVDRNLAVYEVTNSRTGQVTFMSDHQIQDASEEWVKGAQVPESREEFLLTLSGDRAHEVGLADRPCNDMDELRFRLGIPENAPLQPVGRTWVDTFVFVLNTTFGGFMLITLGIICVYVELHVPSGFFGIISAVFFALFFWSRYLGGTAGTLELVLFLLGLVLLGLELFVVPGFGIFGVSGLLMVMGSLVMASHTFAGMSAGESFDESMSSLGSLAGAMVTVIAVAAAMNRFLPSIPFLNRLILTPPGYAATAADGPRLDPTLMESSTDGPVLAGALGVTASTLRPTGKAMFGDQFLDVVSDGGYIDHGTPVEVIRVAGKRIIVRPTPGKVPGDTPDVKPG
jgi:membrane-bound serine protease (ClpP class)